MKTAFEKEIDRLNADNRELRNQLKRKDIEINHLKQAIKDSDERYQKLIDHHERYLFDYSEKIEAAEEARIAYESKTEELRKLIRQYTKEADQWISAMKSQRKAV